TGGRTGFASAASRSGFRAHARAEQHHAADASPAAGAALPGSRVSVYHPCDMSPRRLYLDNAATSFPKPKCVIDAMTRYATELGASAGRGAYAEAIETGELMSECRRRLKTLFNGERAEHFVFTLNCTDGLNLAIKGLIDPARKNHAICTRIDHNSILRPIQSMVDLGWIEQTCVPVDSTRGIVDPDDIRKAIRGDTKLIAITHASNVTGTVQPIGAIGRIAREHG